MIYTILNNSHKHKKRSIMIKTFLKNRIILNTANCDVKWNVKIPKLKLFLILVLTTIVLPVWSNPIDENTARKVASQTLSRSSASHSSADLQLLCISGSNSELNIVKRASQIGETVYFYVFGGENNEGFVIVAGDDRVAPVLGYSFSNNFSVENMPSNLTWWFEDYARQIEYAIENDIAPTLKTEQQWMQYLSNEYVRNLEATIGPLLETTWSQSPYYNQLCPEGSLTGCVATAMAQVMKYHNHPIQGAGTFSYNHSTYGTLSANFGETIYQWNNMPPALTYTSSPEQINAVATLMYHCGVALEMTYSPISSGALGIGAIRTLPTFFGYDYNIAVASLYGENPNINDWYNLLRTELNANRPIIYSHAALSHNLVCDGYTDDNLFHFNWGWGGSNNGWYLPALLHSTGFNYMHGIVYNIKPCEGALSWEIGDPIPANVIATLSNGTLTINGIGATQNWSNANRPWNSYFSSVIINNGVTNIGSYASGDNRYLNSVTMGDNVTSIGNNAFYSCKSLSSIEISNSVTSIGNSAFSTCNSLTDLTIPNSVTSIGSSAFAGCRSLISLLIPNSVTSIGSSAFAGCTSLISIDVESNNMNYTSENGVLFNKSKTTLICYPAAKSNTFYTIPNSVIQIMQAAFYYCFNLSSIIIPNSVSVIANSSSTFSNCSSLTDVTVNWTTPLSIGTAFFSSITLANVNLHVPAGTECVYKATPIWGIFNIIGLPLTITPSASSGGTISPSGAQTVNCGGNQTFTATPNSCQEVNQWTVNGSVVQTGGTTYTVSNVQGNTTVNVTFKIKTYTVTPSAGSGGSISPSIIQTVNCGGSQLFTATPGSCQEVNQWSVNGNVVQTGGTTYTVSNVQANTTVQVTFKIKTYTVTPSAGSGGTISPSGVQTVNCGGNQTFTATPNSCQEVNQWLVNGSVVQTGGTTYTVSNVQANTTINVTFKIKTYTVTPSAGSGGTISPNSLQTVDCGSSKSFTAFPNNCNEVDQWKVNNSVVQTGGNNYTIQNVQANTTVNVTFKPITYTVTATAGNGGNISPSGVQSVECGNDKTFTATPNDCQEVDQWTVNGNVVQVGGATYTISNIQANATVNVTFKAITHTITASAGDGGTISPSGVQTVDCGSSQTFYFEPNTCYYIAQVLIDGVNNPEAIINGSYSFENIMENHKIVVTFAIYTYNTTVSANPPEGGTAAVVGAGGENVSCGTTIAVVALANTGYNFVNWTSDGTEVSTNVIYSFTATENVDLVAHFKKDSVSIVETQGIASLQVYPNPTSGELYVEISDFPISDYQISDIRIFDLMGRQVSIVGQSQIGQSQIVINVAPLPSGMYFLKIGEKTVKFVKE